MRDSDIEIQEEAEDLVREFETRLKERRLGDIVRLKIEASMPDDLRAFIIRELEADPRDVVIVDGMLGLAALSALVIDERARPEFKPLRAALPRAHPRFRRRLLRGDPRQGHAGPPPVSNRSTSVVQFLRQAAADPAVVAIKQTLYRTSKDSPIVAALVAAAEAGQERHRRRSR